MTLSSRYRVAWDTLDRFTVRIQWKAFGTQSYALIQLHVISDDARLTITTPVPWSMVKWLPMAAPG